MPGLAQPDERPINPKDEATAPDAGQSSDPKPVRGLEEKELEAALQLLVERAQYITGATGTALAVLHGEEMVCCASAGSCAPAIGARLQVRSGLTGESISRRQLLRCDNAETDPRVNLETCRALGIASIIVLPLLRRNGEVRGLFELFSDHPYAFEERDLTALERMADLTATALDLAEQRQGSVPPPLPAGTKESSLPSAPTPAPSVATAAQPMSQASAPAPVAPVPSPIVPQGAVPPVAQPLNLAAANAPSAATSAISKPVPAAPAEPAIHPSTTVAQESEAKPAAPASNIAEVAPGHLSPVVIPIQSPAAVSAPLASPPAELPPSVPVSTAPVTLPEMPIATAVPEAMRRVQKCASCGFPVSEGRSLCLDCEKKQVDGKPVPAKLTLVSQDAEGAPVEGKETLPEGESEVLPPFLANAVPVKESWLADHVNVLAIIVLILGILVAVVVFR
jgi:putative methionine-R-sulfoxide reductase with GAF domain